MSAAASTPADEGLLVLRAARRHVWLLEEEGPRRHRVRGGERLVPGDRVIPAADGAIDGPAERRNALERRTVKGDRLLAANLDGLLILLAHGTRDGGEGFIARCVAAAAAEGIEPLLVFNKADLDTEGDLGARMALHERLGFRVLRVSAQSGEGLEALEALLAGKVTALVGFSGVGKSTLINALDLEAEIPEGDVDEKGRGRHTTTLGQAYPWKGGALIDLPGIRSFGLLSEDGIDAAFPELAGLAEGCRFADCQHLTEPDCAVLEALEAGEVEEERLEVWRGIRESVESDGEGRW
ncbi:MAG: ribosome small subunit-dependent GTPase A [Deltaproteobacteria bacterium]|nr:ribosome small subunit-dependent GTPase A [Deltaproteobacteria bacterium]